MKCLVTKERFNIVNVYSALCLVEKRKMWLELEEIINSSLGQPVCIVGDLNSVRGSHERLNYEYKKMDLEGFNSFIMKNNLLEV